MEGSSVPIIFFDVSVSFNYHNIPIINNASLRCRGAILSPRVVGLCSPLWLFCLSRLQLVY